MKKKKKSKTPHYFILDWGMWGQETLVCVGIHAEEVQKILEKINKNGNVTVWFKQFGFDVYKKSEQEKKKGIIFFTNKIEAIVPILRLADWKEDWIHYGILMHELVHAIDFMSEHGGWEKEMEARATTFEYLFCNARRALS